jgi:hypothetical protein
MPKGKRNKIQVLYEAFAGSPRDFSAAPFVFLNDDMDVSVIGDILTGLSRKGFAGVVISARTGLSVPFASDEYWQRISAAIERARELSMSVWLCCDYNRPIGTGAGRLIIERPEFCAGGLIFRTAGKTDPHERVIGTYLTKGRSITYLAEHPGRKRCLVASVAAMHSPTPSLPDARRIPEGGTDYLDILNRDAVGHYINTVLGSLQANLEKYFGNTLVGILIQSPQNQCPFPWTDCLPDLFKKKYGYDLVACLPSLIRDVGDFPTVRADYYRLIGDLTRDYYRAIRLWARQHNLSFSATIGGEGFVEKIPQTQGNLYAVLSEMNVPGTSYRCNGTNYLNDTPPSLLRNFTPKFASSIARTTKNDRALSAVWEGEGWGVTPRLLKRTIDCGVSLGITTFFTRGVFASIVGLRKRDFPPSYYIQLPYWDDIHILSDYISRTCLMMSAGHSKAEILVFFPLMSLWVNTLGLGRLRRDGNKIVTGLNNLIGALISDHRDFDFVFEEMLDRRLVRFTDGAIAIGPNRYSTLVIPWATHISASIFSFIESAQKNGINVVFIGRYPIVFGKPESPTVGIGHTLLKDAENLIHYLRVKTPGELSISGDNSEKFVHQRRTLPGADIYFLSYLGDEQFTGTLALPGTGTPEAWDPENGRRYLISEFQVTDDGIRFPVTFDPDRSWIYVVHSEYTDTLYGLPALPEHKVGEFFFPSRWTVDYRSDNMFRIDNLRLIRSSPPVSFPPLSDLWKDTRFGLIAKIMMSVVRAFTDSVGRIFRIRKKIGYRSYTTMELEMRRYFLAARIFGLSLSGQSRYQQIDLIKDATRYMGLFLSTPLPPEGAEFEIEASFMATHVPRRICLVWEDIGEPIDIYVNGVLVSDRSRECFLWDRHNRMADLSGIVKWGTNQIGIRSRQTVYPSVIPALHWIEPIVLTGDFGVNQDIITTRKETTRHLLWGRKRTGNYSGAVSYRCAFYLPKRFTGKRAILDLGDVRVACRVVLNGRDMGARLWPPYRYEVTDALKPGENEIEISVTNTAENLLGMPMLSGIVTDPKIAFFDPR